MTFANKFSQIGDFFIRFGLFLTYKLSQIDDFFIQFGLITTCKLSQIDDFNIDYDILRATGIYPQAYKDMKKESK